jgi:hypothetical protein
MKPSQSDGEFARGKRSPYGRPIVQRSDRKPFVKQTTRPTISLCQASTVVIKNTRGSEFLRTTKETIFLQLRKIAGGLNV